MWLNVFKQALKTPTLQPKHNLSVSPERNGLSVLLSLVHASILRATGLTQSSSRALCYTRDEKYPCHTVTLPRLFAYFICDWETPVPSKLMLGQSAGDEERITYPIFSFPTAVLSYFSIRPALVVCLASFLSFFASPLSFSLSFTLPTHITCISIPKPA